MVSPVGRGPGLPELNRCCVLKVAMNNFMKWSLSGMVSVLVSGGVCLWGDVDPAVGKNLPGGVAEPAPPAFEGSPSPLLEEEAFRFALPGVEEGEGVLNVVRFFGAPEEIASADREEDSSGVQVKGVALLAELPEWQESFAARYLGQTFTRETLGEILEALQTLYFAEERPLVYIQPVKVDYANGVVEFLVLESRLRHFSAQGARWFNDDDLLASLRLQEGEPLRRDVLLNDLAWLNRNPFRHSEVVLSPGTEAGTTDLEIQTRDRFPLRGFVNVDNTGSEQTGEWRWTAGLNWGKAFGLDHQMNYQYSAPFENLRRQQVHAGSYLVPLPWRHQLAVYGSLAYTDLDILVNGNNCVNFDGEQTQLSLRYQIPLGNLYGEFTHELQFGIDWKTTDTEYLFGGQQIPANKTSVWQGMLGYNATLRDSLGATSVGVELYGSPGGIGDTNSRSAYRQVNPNLRPDYLYGMLRLNRITRLPADFSLVGQFTAQFASGTLPSSEQLSIGGFGTVRGYRERVLFGDQGVVVNLELRSPGFSLGSRLFPGSFRDQMQLLAFLDYGWIDIRGGSGIPGMNEDLASVGVGVRYSIDNHLNLRADVGFPLKDPKLGFAVHDARVSLGLSVGF